MVRAVHAVSFSLSPPRIRDDSRSTPGIAQVDAIVRSKRSLFDWGSGEEYRSGVRIHPLVFLSSEMMPSRAPRNQWIPVARLGKTVTSSLTIGTMETAIELPLRSRTPSPDQIPWLMVKSAIQTVKSHAFLCLLDPPGRRRPSLCSKSV